MDADWKKMERVTVAVEPDLMGLIPNFLTRKRDDLQTLKDALESGDLNCRWQPWATRSKAKAAALVSTP